MFPEKLYFHLALTPPPIRQYCPPIFFVGKDILENGSHYKASELSP